jgi:hypothetical protein
VYSAFGEGLKEAGVTVSRQSFLVAFSKVFVAARAVFERPADEKLQEGSIFTAFVSDQ